MWNPALDSVVLDERVPCSELFILDVSVQALDTVFEL